MAAVKAKVDWFEAAMAALGTDPGYRRLGSADMTVAFVIGEAKRTVTFETFAIRSVQDVDEAGLRDADLVIRMPVRLWNGYLRDRKRGTAPSLLSLDLDERIVEAHTPLGRLAFERYNASLQAFVDKGAQLAA
jgi:hypothetical protein